MAKPKPVNIFKDNRTTKISVILDLLVGFQTKPKTGSAKERMNKLDFIKIRIPALPKT